jgi:putative lipoic acid-binding regulatory protein
MTERPTDIKNEELWDFPMNYPLKVMGEARHPMAQIVADLISKYVPSFDPSSIEMQASSKGKYVSIRVVFYAERKEQINDIYAALAAEPAVRMAL